ncbi:MAG TPA: OmpA family protein [Flavisolibacter sp.]|nr:OmpA family protein [Flavisolibacter sp.]
MKSLIFFFLVFEARAQTKDTLFSIYFENNSYYINITQRDALKNIINKNTPVFSIKGFADSVGQSKFNFILIENRLKSTVAFLKEINVDLRTTPIINGGEEVLNDAGLSLSRRVDIKIGIETTGNKNSYNNSYNKDSIKAEIKKFNSLAQFQFEPDKTILTFDSYQYIDDLYEILRTNDVAFEIIGHVNYQSKRDPAYLKDLYELSTNRAKVIYELLLERGIRAERMSYRGVGNSEPVFRDPKNEEEKRKNMRVEIIIK